MAEVHQPERSDLSTLAISPEEQGCAANWAIQDRLMQNRAIQNRAIQNRAMQNRAMQNRAMQNRAIQNRATHGVAPTKKGRSFAVKRLVIPVAAEDFAHVVTRFAVWNILDEEVEVP